MRKIVFLWMALMIVSIHAFADGKVSFTASAPDAVAVGDQFRLSYTVTTQKVRDFRTPSIKGFDVLMGPSRSQQKSVQIINGETTSTSSITFTYILMATAEGSFTIPGATITAEGNQMVSNSVHINVLPADQAGELPEMVEDKAVRQAVLHQERQFQIVICLLLLRPVRQIYMSKRRSC